MISCLQIHALLLLRFRSLRWWWRSLVDHCCDMSRLMEMLHPQLLWHNLPSLPFKEPYNNVSNKSFRFHTSCLGTKSQLQTRPRPQFRTICSLQCNEPSNRDSTIIQKPWVVGWWKILNILNTIKDGGCQCLPTCDMAGTHSHLLLFLGY